MIIKPLQIYTTIVVDANYIRQLLYISIKKTQCLSIESFLNIVIINSFFRLVVGYTNKYQLNFTHQLDLLDHLNQFSLMLYANHLPQYFHL